MGVQEALPTKGSDRRVGAGLHVPTKSRPQAWVSYLPGTPGVLGPPTHCSPPHPRGRAHLQGLGTPRPWAEPRHSLFCPAAPATSSWSLAPSPAVPGLSSKAPVIWWQRVPGHWLISFLFLVSPGGQRGQGVEPSRGTQQKDHLLCPWGPAARELESSRSVRLWSPAHPDGGRCPATSTARTPVTLGRSWCTGTSVTEELNFQSFFMDTATLVVARCDLGGLGIPPPPISTK